MWADSLMLSLLMNACILSRNGEKSAAFEDTVRCAMELIRGLHNLPKAPMGCVATIGNFDGVHLGHQAIFTALEHAAKVYQLPSVVILFEPQPKEFFMPDKAPPRLYRLRDKLNALKRFPVDKVFCITFDRAFAGVIAQNFIEEVLVSKLGVEYLVVGNDFRFGHRRLGDVALLKQYDFEVVSHPEIEVKGKRVSATRVRQALAENKLELAQQLLGRAYSLCGRVHHGDKRGQQIGVPTMNVALAKKMAVSGVYAVKVSGLNGQVYCGVANVGVRPTVDGVRRFLEVHLFGFNEQCYGKKIEVEFVAKLREEQRFPDFAALEQQIQQDIMDAKRCFDFKSSSL